MLTLYDLNVNVGGMTEFDAHTLAHLKKLCRISCTPEEDEDILNSLPRILEHVAALAEVNTDDVKPCSYVLSTMLNNQMREDEAGHTLSREKFLSNAPDQIGGMIRVPPVLK